MIKNLKYLINVGFDKNIVLERPQLLGENPDALAKKMRVFKLYVLGLRRGAMFDLNEFRSFWSMSPATLIAKIKVCRENGIDYKNSMSLLRATWLKLFQKFDSSISKKESQRRGKELTVPIKKKYDEWMRHYKIWAEEFSLKRKRRLIINI